MKAGHGVVVQVLVSRDNKLVSASKDGHVRVWDLDTQHCCQVLTGYKGEVWSLDMDPKETRIITGRGKCAGAGIIVIIIVTMMKIGSLTQALIVV